MLKTKNVIKIERLNRLTIISPIEALLEEDGDGYIARTPDLPLYGFGDDAFEAVSMLKDEIESLYFEISETSDISSEWVSIKKYLQRKVAPVHG